MTHTHSRIFTEVARVTEKAICFLQARCRRCVISPLSEKKKKNDRRNLSTRNRKKVKSYTLLTGILVKKNRLLLG